MREIKFRAWVKPDKKMGDVEVLSPKGAFVLGANPKDQKLADLEAVLRGRTYRVIQPTNGRFVEIEDLVIMQYTGLKDKNGKEVYEGDIVKWDEDYDLIEYDDGCFVLPDTNDCSECLYRQHSNIEVVGNKYESPELLKRI